MTLDDRAYRAADGLRRSVRRSVDPDVALSAVTGRRDRRWGGGVRGSRSSGRLVAAAAAVALLVGTVAFAVTRSPSAGVDTDGERDRELIEALPAGPVDGKESLRLPMVVTPQEGVSEGSVVRITGRGFEPQERVGAVMCASEADTGHAGVDACQLGEGFVWVTYGNADAEGNVSLRVTLRRFVETPKYGRVDCLSAPERCLVAVGAVSDYDRSGGAYVRFAGAPDFPTPSFVVEPTHWTDGQLVRVVARRMLAGRTYVVEQCAADDRCTPLAYGRLGDDGTVTTAVSLHREIAEEDGTPADCTTVCELRISYVGPEGASSAPEPAPVAVTFDPAPVPGTLPPTTAAPGVSTVPPSIPPPSGPTTAGPTTLPPTSSTTTAPTTTVSTTTVSTTTVSTTTVSTTAVSTTTASTPATTVGP